MYVQTLYNIYTYSQYNKPENIAFLRESKAPEAGAQHSGESVHDYELDPRILYQEKSLFAIFFHSFTATPIAGYIAVSTVIGVMSLLTTLTKHVISPMSMHIK